MKTILAARGIQLTKSLGQNFLHDANQLRRIVAAGAVTAADTVLEIGPGLGPLTALLVENAGHVLAIEKDGRLVEFLAERFRDEPRIELRHADALEVVREKGTDWSAWKLVANLPYSVASPILVELAWAAGSPVRMVATLQLEVANRIVSGPDDADYGILSLLLQLRYEAGGLFKIPAACFFPAPDVDSACITLVRRPEALLDAAGEKFFMRLVKQGFSQRRKMMLKLLKGSFGEEPLRAGFAAAGIDAQARAEAVSLEQFVTLARSLEEKHGG